MLKKIIFLSKAFNDQNLSMLTNYTIITLSLIKIKNYPSFSFHQGTAAVAVSEVTINKPQKRYNITTIKFQTDIIPLRLRHVQRS